LLSDHLVVLTMRADPDSHDAVRDVDAECAMMDAGANRPEIADALEVQRRVARIRTEQLIVLIRNLSDFPEAGPRTAPRTCLMRSASKLPCPARFVFRSCLRSELIQLPGFCISLDLRIPSFPVLLQEPFAQLREFFAGKLLNLLFDLLNLAHIPPRRPSIRLRFG
jgi:hypothetical protein